MNSSTLISLKCMVRGCNFRTHEHTGQMWDFDMAIMVVQIHLGLDHGASEEDAEGLADTVLFDYRTYGRLDPKFMATMDPGCSEIKEVSEFVAESASSGSPYEYVAESAYHGAEVSNDASTEDHAAVTMPELISLGHGEDKISRDISLECRVPECEYQTEDMEFGCAKKWMCIHLKRQHGIIEDVLSFIEDGIVMQGAYESEDLEFVAESTNSKSSLS